MPTALLKLEIRQADIEARFGEIGGMPADDLTDEIRSELAALRTEHADNGSQQSALKLAGGQSAPVETRTALHQTREGAELAGLLQQASIGQIFADVLEHRISDGANRELQQHYGLASNAFPLDLLVGRQLETRAAATISGDTEADQQPVLPQVFPASVSGFLGISQPTVPTGQAIFPVLTTGATVGTPARSATQAETTGAFTAYTIEGSRVQAAFSYTREDAAKFPMLDDSLRQNLSDALMSKLDDLNINDATNGLLGTNGLTNPTDPTTMATFADYINLVYSSVDGTYAGMASDVRLAMAVAAYQHAGGAFRGNNSDVPAIEHVMRIAGGVMATPHIADAAGNDDTVIARRGSRMDMVNPIWNSVNIIFDEVTKAADGEVVLTAYLLSGRRLLRSDGFARYEVQTA